MPGNAFQLGRTHVIHTLNVVGGSLTVNVTDIAGAPSAYVSGFQLIVVPEPSALLGIACLAPLRPLRPLRPRRR